MKHLEVTHSAANTVMKALQYFKAKKKTYMLMYKNGDINRSNAFLMMMQRNSSTHTQRPEESSNTRYSENKSSDDSYSVNGNHDANIRKKLNSDGGYDYFFRQIMNFSHEKANSNNIL